LKTCNCAEGIPARGSLCEENEQSKCLSCGSRTQSGTAKAYFNEWRELPDYYKISEPEKIEATKCETVCFESKCMHERILNICVQKPDATVRHARCLKRPFFETKLVATEPLKNSIQQMLSFIHKFHIFFCFYDGLDLS